MKIFEIPVCFRLLSIGEEERRKKSSLVMIDGKGVFLSYAKKEDFFNIKENPSVKRSFLFVPAKNYTEALADVFARCEGMNFGGDGVFEKAAWIDKTVAIIEYPFCFMLHKTGERFLCKEISSKPHYLALEDYEPCFVQDFEYKRDCPISLCRINVLLNYWAEAKNSKKIIFQEVEYDFLKIRYEFDSPKVGLKDILVKSLLGTPTSK